MLPPRYKPITTTVIPGGFGHVLKVRDSFLDRPVLFKRMHSAAHNAQLINEIQSLSKARSRHVVEIYDVILDKNGNIEGIIIELLEGREFDQFHLGFKSDLGGFLRIIYQIATALADMHLAGVVHRDLKLDNIRETKSGIVKLFDFGISTVGAGYSTKNNRGTLLYAAPELFTSGVTITSEMDIYALGICAWALTTNALPSELHERPPQASKRAPSIDAVSPGIIPPSVVNLLDRCIDPDPSLRPTALEVSRALAQQLVRGQHKGLFADTSKGIYELSDNKKNVRLKIGGLGELKVAYDGLTFRIAEVAGDVFVNNKTAVIDMELPEACVLAFGSSGLGAGRTWIPFTSSHPEVIL